MATAAPPAPTGPAHVAVVSFLAARAAPTGGFWIALAGGVALARVAQRRGARAGFGSSVAAMLETVAIIGPARFGIPFTQAVTAPLLGRLEARGWSLAPQILTCGVLRLIHNTATTAFFIWVITGGLDAYAGTYDALGRRLGIDVGTADALALTAAGLLVWAIFASVIQVLVYRRGLRDWDQRAAVDAGSENLDDDDPPAASEPEPPAYRRGRFDPRAVTVAAAVAFGLLLVSTEWLVLGAVSAWLALAWASATTDREPVPVGLLFAAVLGLGALVFTLGGGLGLDLALRRALRAALIVLVATWLRAAAGAEGLREVFRRGLGRLRAIPSLPEAVTVLDGIAAEGRLVAAARTLADRLRGVALRPLPFLDAVLDWVVGEAQAFRPLAPGIPPTLALRARDVLLVVLAGAAPAVALTFG
ncbi:MAG TPA: hypothetical protein VHJ37_00880 [Thermoleophilaceae bacterium]|nr:hypothetical protein [Thermoleophilaceae bacterium]